VKEENKERQLMLHEGDESPEVKCTKHGSCRKPWIMCDHLGSNTEPKVAHRVQEEHIAGEVLCATCFEALNAGTGPEHEEAQSHLLIACETCVLDKFKLTTSN